MNWMGPINVINEILMNSSPPSIPNFMYNNVWKSMIVPFSDSVLTKMPHEYPHALCWFYRRRHLSVWWALGGAFSDTPCDHSIGTAHACHNTYLSKLIDSDNIMWFTIVERNEHSIWTFECIDFFFDCNFHPSLSSAVFTSSKKGFGLILLFGFSSFFPRSMLVHVTIRIHIILIL